MTRKILLAALLALAIVPQAFAADDGWHPGRNDCTGAVDSSPSLLPGETASWCPITATSEIVFVKSFADCNWNADTTSTTAGIVAGQKTLTATKCSGSTTAASDCKNVLTDSNSNTTITSGDPTGSFTLASGFWLVATTDAAAATNGRLLCTGR